MTNVILLEMQQYIVYRIVLSLYRCIDTKSNRIDISRIVIYRCIVACFNEIIVPCDDASQRKNSLKKQHRIMF